jgi:hypothetical protein
MIKTWRRRSDQDGLQKLATERPTRSVRDSDESRVTSDLTRANFVLIIVQMHLGHKVGKSRFNY